jgi:hypothetical protein
MKTKKEIATLMDRIFKDLHTTREAGQKEYAHDESNAFANFERTANELGLTREQVLWVFFNKHKDGVASYINGHKSQREDVRGRIKDMMVYLVLLWGMVEDSESLSKLEPFINNNAKLIDNNVIVDSQTYYERQENNYYCKHCLRSPMQHNVSPDNKLVCVNG